MNRCDISKFLKFSKVIFAISVGVFGAIRAEAAGRSNTLYLDTDPLPSFAEPAQTRATVRAGLEGVTYLPEQGPCLLAWHALPLIYQGFQFGTQCALQTGHSHIFAVELFPEMAIRTGEENINRYRPSVKVALTEAIHLGQFGIEGALIYGRFSQKFSAKEDQTRVARLSKSGYSVIQLQKWADIVESNYSVGWSYRKALDSSATTQSWGTRISYAETLPLELRRFGFLEETAAVSFKTVELSARRNFGAVTFGGGIGYAAITIDTIRFASPYPSLTVDYTW